MEIHRFFSTAQQAACTIDAWKSAFCGDAVCIIEGKHICESDLPPVAELNQTEPLLRSIRLEQDAAGNQFVVVSFHKYSFYSESHWVSYESTSLFIAGAIWFSKFKREAQTAKAAA